MPRKRLILTKEDILDDLSENYNVKPREVHNIKPSLDEFVTHFNNTSNKQDAQYYFLWKRGFLVFNFYAKSQDYRFRYFSFFDFSFADLNAIFIISVAYQQEEIILEDVVAAYNSTLASYWNVKSIFEEIDHTPSCEYSEDDSERYFLAENSLVQKTYDPTTKQYTPQTTNNDDYISFSPNDKSINLVFHNINNIFINYQEIINFFDILTTSRIIIQLRFHDYNEIINFHQSIKSLVATYLEMIGRDFFSSKVDFDAISFNKTNLEKINAVMLYVHNPDSKEEYEKFVDQYVAKLIKLD